MMSMEIPYAFSSKHDSWYEKDGVIYFSVTSDGTIGEDWISRLERKDVPVSDYAKNILRSVDFKSTIGVFKVAILKTTLIDKRTIRRINAEAEKRGLSRPSAELACLIRDKFTNREIKTMGFSDIIIMHQPICDFEFAGTPGRLIVNSRGWLTARPHMLLERFNSKDNDEDGFAFIDLAS